MVWMSGLRSVSNLWADETDGSDVGAQPPNGWPVQGCVNDSFKASVSGFGNVRFFVLCRLRIHRIAPMCVAFDERKSKGSSVFDL